MTVKSVAPIEVFDPRMARILRADSMLERLCGGAEWGEGAVWIPGDGCLLWSDIPSNRMLRWSEDDGMSVFRAPSNFLRVNMPLGASADRPTLSIDEAYDIAAYVNSVLPRKQHGARQALYPLAPFRPAGFVIPEQFPGDDTAYLRHRFGPFTGQ